MRSFVEFDDDLLVLGRVDNDDDENEPAVLFIIEEVETIQTSILDGETTIVFEWMPDWEGEIDLVVRIDSSQVIDEFDEDNTVSLNVNVQPVPEPEGFFGSQSMMPLFGMGLIGAVCIGLLFFATRRIAEGEDTEWLEEEDEDDEFES